MEKEKQTLPGFFAILPAFVRYSDITPNAKLLYAEITALSNKYGYCTASNAYFVRVFIPEKDKNGRQKQNRERTIQTWIASLKEKKFIYIEFVDNFRRIYITSRGGVKKYSGGGEKIFTHGGEKIFTHNNTSNNKLNNTVISQKSFQQIAEEAGVDLEF
jgi:hypothetical protein